MAGVGLLLAYAWMFGEITVPNERSRVYLSVAIVDHHGLSIDPVVRRFGPVADVARHGRRLYTDKAPGSSLLGAIPYAIVRLFTSADDWTAPELVNLERTTLMLPLALLALLLLRRRLRRLGCTEPSVDVASLAFALGSASLHYAAAFFGHAIVVCLFFLALEALAAAEAASRDRSRYAAMAGAGAAAGLAGLVEYQAIVVAALFFVWVAARERRRPSAIGAFVLGALPFAALLLAYDWAAFGGPFELSYRHLVDARVQAHHVRGIGGVGLPTSDATMGSLFGLHRGLVATSPIVLLAPFGIVEIARRGQRGLSVLLAAWIVSGLLFVFGADVWYGGWGFGPRLFVPCLGAVFLAVGPALDRVLPSRLGGVARGAAAWGIVGYVAVTFVFAELPPDFQNPLVDVVVPALSRGLHSPNLVTRLGAPFGVATLLPGAALALLAIGIVVGRGLERSRRAIVPVVGALAVIATLFLVVRAVGPTVSDRRRDSFLSWIEDMTEREVSQSAPQPRGR